MRANHLLVVAGVFAGACEGSQGADWGDQPTSASSSPRTCRETWRVASEDQTYRFCNRINSNALP